MKACDALSEASLFSASGLEEERLIARLWELDALLAEELAPCGFPENQTGDFQTSERPIAPEYDHDSLLAVPPPYDRIYIYWLGMYNALANSEIERYNNELRLYNSIRSEYVNHLIRGALPPSAKIRLGGGI